MDPRGGFTFHPYEYRRVVHPDNTQKRKRDHYSLTVISNATLMYEIGRGGGVNYDKKNENH